MGGFGRTGNRDVGSHAENPRSFNGIWDAIVVNDADPLQRGRVQVRVLDIHDQDTPDDNLPWADPCMPGVAVRTSDPEVSAGFFHVPPIDALVYVQFKQGDPDFPIWMGGFFPSNPAITGREGYTDLLRRKALYNAGGKPSCPTWRSLRGHSIELDDEAGEVRLTTAGGQKITMSDDGANEQGQCIKLEDSKGNYIWLRTDDGSLQIRFNGDVLEECTGNRSIKVGGNLNIETGGDMSLTVGGTFHHTAGAAMNLDAPTINLNGGLAQPQPADVVPQGEESAGDSIGQVLQRLGNQIKKIVTGD